jgi:phage terminase small subunit
MLTPKQEAFCLTYVETGNASESYRQAYNAEKMKPETVAKRASELMQDGEVAGRIRELRADAAEAAKVTLEGHLRDLKAIRDKALKAGEFGPAASAEIARGKAAGLYVKKVADVTADLAGRLARARKRNG